MRVLAMYLPQFHNVEENNQWWGDGFTEWTAVKEAKRLFEEHEQPRVPQNKNYYDLLDKNTMLWQSKLMQEYSVDGMCMYHYWFKDGRQILEKPAENLLKWKDINMPFCFSWANETWARSWSNIREKNVWANTFENEKSSLDMGILLEQKYGTQVDWEKHFNYLLPFFRDKRYIKIDGTPLFLIYQASIIPCLKDMIDYWRKLARNSGLPGLYIVGSNCNSSAEKVVDALLYAEPGRSAKMLKSDINNHICKIDYKEINNTILSANRPNKKTYLGAFVGYDDTPRRGIEGMVITNASPHKFSYYLSEIMAKNAAWGNDILFLNAWNEWGEGMYLEPDERFGNQFLELIPTSKKNFTKQIKKYINSDSEFMVSDKYVMSLKEKSEKLEHYLNLLDDWMKLRANDVSLLEILIKLGFKNIGLYGYGVLGKHFLDEVSNSSIKISYIIDQQRDKIHVNIPVYLPNEEFPVVDAVVVGATFYYSEILELLEGKGIKNVISLEMLIRESQ